MHEKYLDFASRFSFEEYRKDGWGGYYVLELAEEKDSLPYYNSMFNERHTFRGEILELCEDVIGEDLVAEAWNSKLADDALDYANRLLEKADKVAKSKNLEHLKDLSDLPDNIEEEESIEHQLHIVYSLVRWIKFYAKAGCEAHW